MTKQIQKKIFQLMLLAAITLVFTQLSFAGFSGHNTKGDFGLLSGSQSPPGWYLVAPMFYHYEADAIKDRDGNEISRHNV